MKVYIMTNLYIFTGLALIILGAILFCLAVYMIAKYEKKLMDKYTFEMVRPKIKMKGKK